MKENKDREFFPTQDENEIIIEVCRQFPWNLRVPFIKLSLLIVIYITILIIGSMIPHYLSLGLNILVLALTIYQIMKFIGSFIAWYYSVYILTNERIVVIKQTGLFGRELSELALRNIQNINLKVDGFWANIYNLGSLEIENLSGSEKMRLVMIHSPNKLHKKIVKAIKDI
jgi:uncharacterized membrane protein YdbT with pleckstrin-like domain